MEIRRSTLKYIIITTIIAIDKEYKDLLRDYEYYVKEALDYTNSTYSRSYSIEKLNQLLKQVVFCRKYDWEYERVSRFEEEYKENDEYARKLLKEIAIERVKVKLVNKLY